jgi:hypothetical protein
MAKKKLPVYKMVIDDNAEDKSGVQFVALVDDPAVQMDWMVFNDHKEETPKEFMFVTNEERRIITGVLMRADYRIYRNDAQGEYYVTFDKQTIEQVMKKFAKLGYHNNVNLMHNSNAIAEGVYQIEMFQVDKARGIQPPKGMEVEDGSLIGSYYIENDAIWAEVKAGTFKGFSVEGFFGYGFNNHSKELNLKELAEDWLNTLNKRFTL